MPKKELMNHNSSHTIPKLDMQRFTPISQFDWKSIILTIKHLWHIANQICFHFPLQKETQVSKNKIVAFEECRLPPKQSCTNCQHGEIDRQAENKPALRDVRKTKKTDQTD